MIPAVWDLNTAFAICAVAHGPKQVEMQGKP